MSVLIRLREEKKFSASECEVATYIRMNPKKIITMNIVRLAEVTFTSPATVIRMCKRIGYKGFTPLKISIASEIKTFEKYEIDITSSDKAEFTDELSEIVKNVTKQNIDSVKETVLIQELDLIAEAIENIYQADYIHFFGLGASHIVALDAQYKFFRIGKGTSVFSQPDQRYIQARIAKPNDLAMVFSYSGETDEMVNLAKILSEQSVKIIACTGLSKNSLMKYSHIHFNVTSKETLFRSAAMSSRITMLHLIDIIYTGYTSKYYEEVKEILLRTRFDNKKGDS